MPGALYLIFLLIEPVQRGSGLLVQAGVFCSISQHLAWGSGPCLGLPVVKHVLRSWEGCELLNCSWVDQKLPQEDLQAFSRRRAVVDLSSPHL